MRRQSLIQRFRSLPWYAELGIFAAATFVITLVVWTGYGFFGREHQVSDIEMFSWERVVNIEAFQTVHYNRTTSKPDTAFNVRTWTETIVVPVTSTDANGRTTVSTRTTTTRYYEYDNNEWRHFRAVVAAAQDHEPHWPDYKLGKGPLGQQNRVSSTPETYTVHIVNDKGVRRTFEAALAEWQDYNEEEAVVAVLSGFGSVKELRRIEAE